MVHIIPFKGLRYNQEKISNPASVVTPPYDIIDEVAQARYYAEHPANIIRLELGFIFPQDTSNNNRYTRAAQYLEKWIEDETLVPEEKPALYIYQQEFYFQGKRLIRTGFVCGLKVEPYATGNILPHEETLSKPKADRLQLMRATKSNFSSIFGLFADEEGNVENILLNEIKGKLPDINIVDEANEVHKVWVITDQQIINRVVDALAEKRVYIADGHHRYETALNYAAEMKEQGHDGYDYVMTTLVNIYNEGLVIFPTHRIVGDIPDFKLEAFEKDLSALFEVEFFGNKDSISSFMQELKIRGEKNHVFGMYADKGLYLLQLKDFDQASRLLPADKSNAWKKLDVALLDNLILDHLLGIGENKRRDQEHIRYSHSEYQLIEQVDSKPHQLGFLLNPTRVEEIIEVAQAGDKMPQKSTYFYPKLITGLIINNLNIK